MSLTTPATAAQTNGTQQAVVRDKGLTTARSIPFDRLPRDMILRAFGVDYAHVHLPEGGDLYVTRNGWPFLEQLLPANWYSDKWYARQGDKLPGSGHVYHVCTRPVGGKSIEVVVKFSRVAREVPLEVATTFPDDVPPEVIANARFNSPMEEFGLVMELRRAAEGPGHAQLLTQRPLAIYAPAQEFELWELGRDDSRFRAHWHLLAQDQENRPKAIELDIKRIYVMLYSWTKGQDAEEVLRAGDISEQECRDLTVLAIQDLRNKGFRVLDNKPKHFILRKRRSDGQILRRNGGRIVYGLVDFELLQRTPAYQTRFKAAQRQRYWELQTRRPQASSSTPLPSQLKNTTIFGVDYLFGTTADDGKLWVVGHVPELFDYFLPDRWRRTPRAKLSLATEVYHTRTRDGIHLVYRRSRVDIPPRVDPLLAGSAAIREHGYNSPFEEVAIAEQLRPAGVSTIYPRAIYRTGHRSSRIAHRRDLRRFITHAHLMTPENASEPILNPDYDYYTIWGYFRGIDAQMVYSQGTGGVTELEQVYDDGLLAKQQYDDVVGLVQRRLQAVGFNVDEMEPYEFAVRVDADGRLHRGDEGEVDVSLSIDAQTAYEYELITEETYRELIKGLEAQFQAAGWENLNLLGHHLLLSMNPDGKLKADESGQPVAVVCNFELIRATRHVPSP
ncbi:MAG: hypothetical protein ABSA52_01335 [Candidatus Binatia bacterium]|jgi:hypothetical protein